MQLARDPVARFVEIANRGLCHALADRLVDRAQLPRLPAHPGDDAGRADRRRAQQIAQGLRDAILREQLLYIEIDRRRPEPIAILRRLHYAFRKRRLRLCPAIPATVDRGLMFRDQHHALWNVEHLPLLVSCRRVRIEPRTAPRARAGLVPNHRVASGDLTQRAALVTLLPAADLARSTAQTPRNSVLLLQPVARRPLRTVRTVQTHTLLQFDVLCLDHREFIPKPLKLASQRCNQRFNLARKRHSTLESERSSPVCKNPKPAKILSQNVTFRTYPR